MIYEGGPKVHWEGADDDDDDDDDNGDDDDIDDL